MREANEQISILGVPSHWGVGIKALTKGPKIFRKYGIIEKLSSAGFEVHDEKDIDCFSNKNVSDKSSRMRFIDEIHKVSKSTSDKVCEIIKEGRIPVVLGGDHSVEIGAISGAAKALKGNIGVVYIDEHGDLNTGITTDTGNIHGMALTAVMGFGDKKISAISGVAVPKENVVHVGAEKFDPQEEEFINAERIKVVKLAEIINDGMRPVIKAIEELSKRVDGVWVSLDIDSIEMAYAPAVTMPDGYGLTYREISTLARYIGLHVPIIGLTVAEYNPTFEKDNKTLDLVIELIASFLGGEYSWYSHEWMDSYIAKMMNQDVLSKNGLLDQYISRLEDNNLDKKYLNDWNKKIKVFLSSVAKRKINKDTALQVEEFAQLIGFAKLGRKNLNGRVRRNIYWKSSEDIKKDSSLGIFQIDVQELAHKERRKLLDYFVRIIYAPLYKYEEQVEIISFLSGLYREQFRQKEDIKIGILHSLSGNMAISETPLVDAYMMAIDEINSSGGLLGKRIKPFIVDGASDPERFKDEAFQLITKTGVKSVFGGWTSSSRKIMKPIFEEYDNLLWYPIQNEGLEESTNIVYTGACPNQQILPAVDWAFKNIGKKFFLVGSDYVFPRSVNEIIKHRIKKLGGKVVGESYLPLEDGHWSEIVKKINSSKTSVIINTINGDSNIAFFDLLRKAGVSSSKIPTISLSISEEEIIDIGHKNVIGDYAIWNYFQSISSKENKEFVKKFKKKYGKDRVITDPIVSAYNSIYLFAEAVRKAKSQNPNEIKKALYNLSVKSPEGNISIFESTQHVSRHIYLGKIDINGQFNIVTKTKKLVHPKIFPSYKSKKEWNEFMNNIYTNYGNNWSFVRESDKI